MKSAKSYAIALLALVLAGMCVVAWREYEQLIALQARASAADTADLQKRLTDADKRVQILEDQLAAATKLADAVASPEDPGAEASRRGPNRAHFRELLANPEFQKLVTLQEKARLDGRYGALFKTLSQTIGLTPEAIDQLKGLLVQRQQARQDAIQAARDQGLSAESDPDTYAKALGEATFAVDQQIQSALGASGYSQYQQYEQTFPQRNTVNQVQVALSYSQAPLSDQQAAALTALLAQDGAPPQQGEAGPRSFQNPAAAAPITAQALADAQTILSPAQMAALQQLYQAQQAQQELRQLIEATEAKATAGAAPAKSGG